MKRKIKLPPMDWLKETAEERRERLRASKPMGTRVEKDKKKYSRKQKHKRREDYE